MQIVSYEEIIKLTPRGVFTVPKKAREGLFDGDGLAKIMRIGNQLVIEPVRALPYSVRSYTDDEIDEFFKLDDQGTKRLKAEGLI